jgi:hypothetical protein
MNPKRMMGRVTKANRRKIVRIKANPRVRESFRRVMKTRSCQRKRLRSRLLLLIRVKEERKIMRSVMKTFSSAQTMMMTKKRTSEPRKALKERIRIFLLMPSVLTMMILVMALAMTVTRRIRRRVRKSDYLLLMGIYII